MTLSVKPSKVAAALLAGTGWQDVQIGTFKIEQIELVPAAGEPAAEDYGFAYKDGNGRQVTGRMSALLAVRE